MIRRHLFHWFSSYQEFQKDNSKSIDITFISQFAWKGKMEAIILLFPRDWLNKQSGFILYQRKTKCRKCCLKTFTMQHRRKKKILSGRILQFLKMKQKIFPWISCYQNSSSKSTHQNQIKRLQQNPPHSTPDILLTEYVQLC